MAFGFASRLLRRPLGASAAAAARAAGATPAVPIPPIEADDEPRYKPIDWALVRRMLAMLRPHRRLYAAAIGFGLVHMLLDMQSPRFIEHIANYVTAFPALGIPRRAGVWHVVAVIALWASVFAGSVVLQRLTILLMTRGGEAVQF